MNISIDWNGCYPEHKEYFDAMALAMQKAGHRVGIITGEREKDPYNKTDKTKEILGYLGFKPDFLVLWGEYETIANGNMWKAQKLIDNQIAMHFDDDATEMKKYTDIWIVKVLNRAEKGKF